MAHKDTPEDLLMGWLRRQLPAPAMSWLDGQFAKLEADGSDRDLHIALGMAPRRLGRGNLQLGAEDLEAAQEIGRASCRERV